MVSKAERARRAKVKQWIKDMTMRIRQIKKDKANAYREGRLEDAKLLESDQLQLSQHVYRHHWYAAEQERNHLFTI
jgi:arsenate reductase-like glutaredoxin family protein